MNMYHEPLKKVLLDSEVACWGFFASSSVLSHMLPAFSWFMSQNSLEIKFKDSPQKPVAKLVVDGEAIFEAVS